MDDGGFLTSLDRSIEADRRTRLCLNQTLTLVCDVDGGLLEVSQSGAWAPDSGPCVCVCHKDDCVVQLICE